MNIGIHIVQSMFNIVPKRNKACAFYGGSLFEKQKSTKVNPFYIVKYLKISSTMGSMVIKLMYQK
jgi:hypothetical protein